MQGWYQATALESLRELISECWGFSCFLLYWGFYCFLTPPDGASLCNALLCFPSHHGGASLYKALSCFLSLLDYLASTVLGGEPYGTTFFRFDNLLVCPGNINEGHLGQWGVITEQYHREHLLLDSMCSSGKVLTSATILSSGATALEITSTLTTRDLFA